MARELRWSQHTLASAFEPSALASTPTPSALASTFVPSDLVDTTSSARTGRPAETPEVGRRLCRIPFLTSQRCDPCNCTFRADGRPENLCTSLSPTEARRMNLGALVPQAFGDARVLERGNSTRGCESCLWRCPKNTLWIWELHKSPSTNKLLSAKEDQKRSRPRDSAIYACIYM